MSRRRRNTSSPEPDDSHSPKRRHMREAENEYSTSDEDESHEAPRVDPYTGQAAAFPGLGYGDELFYGPANDGIDFLRMVRSEARSVPAVLVAPSFQPRDLDDVYGKVDKNIDHERGFFHDGAYTATVRSSEAPGTNLPPFQQQYYQSMLVHFQLVQATLKCTPAVERVLALQPNQLISLPGGSKEARRRWESHILSQDPSPVQVACLDCESVVELIKLLTRKLRVWLQEADSTATTRVGAWVWAILGKCRHRGELSSEEVGELRILAQSAAHILSQLSERWDGDVGNRLMEDEHEDSASETSAGQGVRHGVRHRDELAGLADAVDQVGDSLNVAVVEESWRDELSASLQQRKNLLADIEKRKLMTMTLDMVVTVVGEVYGQRDLLGCRSAWSVNEVGGEPGTGLAS